MTSEKLPRIAILHYSAPPVIGGVENVILAHIQLLLEAGCPTTVLAGTGEQEALPLGTGWSHIPEMDSQHPLILEMSPALDKGTIPPGFEEMTSHLVAAMKPVLRSTDCLVVHNVFTKHFNLPLTAALFRLLDDGSLPSCIAWCHDSTWTSPRSRSRVHPGYPWDLLRTRHPKITYVTVSQERQQELAGLFGCPPEQIRVIYNGVDPDELLALSESGRALIDRLGLYASDLNLLMPVRVTQAKNIELALHTLAALKERGLRAKLVVTGPPDPHDPANMEYYQSLLSLRGQLGLTRQAHFVYVSGPVSSEPFTVDMPIVAELFRVSDALFMPSHREGFGMPILEASLAGLPVFCSDRIPAAREIGRQDVFQFRPDANPDHVAETILEHVGKNPVLHLRRHVRQNLTWRGLFERQIFPLLKGDEHDVQHPE